VNPRAPSPERIAHWEEQALALMAVRTSEENVLAHLRDVECPLEIARAIVARCRTSANARIRRKMLGTIATGLGVLALAAAYFSLMRAPDTPRVLRPIAYFSIGLGMVMYGLMELVFDRIDARKKRGGYTRRRPPIQPRR
jgi:hypothetical protein